MLQFMVRSGNDLRTLASRINVPARDLAKVNKLHSLHFIAYPGCILKIPVHIQPRIWDPLREDNSAIQPSPDRKTGDEFELVVDSSNFALGEDLINMDEIRADSAERDNIKNHLRKLDAQIGSLSRSIDSLKHNEFSFESEEGSSNALIEKMKMSRDKYYSESPLGKSLDSLRAIKSKLLQRCLLLNNKLTDYEYLSDNAAYSQRNFKPNERDKEASWSDHLAYDMSYIKSKNPEAYKGPPPVASPDESKAKPEPVAAAPAAQQPPVQQGTAPATAVGADRQSPPPAAIAPVPPAQGQREENQLPPVKEQALVPAEPTQPVPTNKTPAAAAPLSPPPAAPVAVQHRDDSPKQPAPKPKTATAADNADHVFIPLSSLGRKDRDNEVVEDYNPDADTAEAPVRVDYAALHPLHFSHDIRLLDPVARNTELALLPKAAAALTDRPAAPLASSEMPKPAAAATPEQPAKTATVMPPAEQQAPPKTEEPPRPKEQEVKTIGTQPGLALNEPVLKPKNIDSRAETAKKEKTVSEDPLAAYKTDSSFAVQKVAVKEIPLATVKNRPKYLIPVDTPTAVRAAALLQQSRSEFEKGDFKNGEKSLRRCLDLNPNSAAAWMLHADLFLTQGLADQALKEYLIACEIDSTNPKVFYNIALLYVKANNAQKAYLNFTRAIEADGKYVLAYMGRASLQAEEHDYDGAIQDYDRILAMNKYFTPAYRARGLAKMQAGIYADAVNDFNQYLDIEDPDGFVFYERGLAKIFSNEVMQGCIDLANAKELGYGEAEKAISRFCR